MTRLIQRKIAEIPEFRVEKKVVFENPSIEAKLPVCVISNFMARPRGQKTSYALSITAECWADKYYPAIQLFDKTALKLAEIGFIEVADPIDTTDPVTQKRRYGSRFEGYWNAMTNYFEVRS